MSPRLTLPLLLLASCGHDALGPTDHQVGEPADAHDPTTQNNPVSGPTCEGIDACDAIESRVGHCQNYGYDCTGDAFDCCILHVFEQMVAPCSVFVSDALCAGNFVSEIGHASCRINECQGIVSYESCIGSLEILCAYPSFP